MATLYSNFRYTPINRLADSLFYCWFVQLKHFDFITHFSWS